LQRAIGVGEFGADGADFVEAFVDVEHFVEPAVANFGVVVEQDNMPAFGDFSRFVAVAQEAEVGFVDDDFDVVDNLVDFSGLIGRAVVDDDDFITALVFAEDERGYAVVGQFKFVMYRDDDGDIRFANLG